MHTEVLSLQGQNVHFNTKPAFELSRTCCKRTDCRALGREPCHLMVSAHKDEHYKFRISLYGFMVESLDFLKAKCFHLDFHIQV